MFRSLVLESNARRIYLVLAFLIWTPLPGSSFLLVNPVNQCGPPPPKTKNCGSLLTPTTTTSPRVQDARRDPEKTTTTALNMLLEVPDGPFFAVTFPMLGILLSLSKNFARLRMEERAWEQRLEEARIQRLKDDPTLTELDLRRREAAMEWSAYGKPRQEEEDYKKQQEEYFQDRQRQRRGSRVAVMERDDDEDDDVDRRQYRMTDDEIDQFELEYGVEYDPYYDDPYTEEELPEGKFDINKQYGDRVYENGEIFYKDNKSGMYYRQGAKPRSVNFW